jgi:hypothetical protein
MNIMEKGLIGPKIVHLKTNEVGLRLESFKFFVLTQNLFSDFGLWFKYFWNFDLWLKFDLMLESL